MSVYVDPLNAWGGDNAPRCFRNKPSCHMYADSLEELHAMATSIGLLRSWFQNSRTCPHYDLTSSKRGLAVQRGAVEHASREQIVAKWREISGRSYGI